MNITKWILLFTIAALIIFDVWATKNGVPTESQTLRDWAHVSTCLPFTAGVLMGHWFFPRRTASKYGWMIALPIMVVLGARDIYWFLKVYSTFHATLPWWDYSGVYALAGIPIGMFLWGQTDDQSPLN